jgi:hypothetical protein
MRIKTHQSTEERRAAIAKEIEAITVDIERVRSLVTHEQEPVASEDQQRVQQSSVHAAPRTNPGLS